MTHTSIQPKAKPPSTTNTHLARGELRIGLGVGVGGVLQLGSHPRDFALRTALRLRNRLDTQYVVAIW